MNFLRKILVPFRLWRRGLSLPMLTTICGVNSADFQGAIAQSRKEDTLQLVHTPTDKYPHNVYVYNIELNRIIGYLERDLAKALVSVFGNGFCLDGTVEEIFGNEENPPFVAQIAIYQSMTLMRPHLQNLPYCYENPEIIKKQ